MPLFIALISLLAEIAVMICVAASKKKNCSRQDPQMKND
jgi:hypothetical protein